MNSRCFLLISTHLVFICEIRSAPADFKTLGVAANPAALRAFEGSELARIKLPPQSLKVVMIPQTNLSTAAHADPRRLKVLVQDQATWKQIDTPTATNRDQLMITSLPRQLSVAFVSETNRLLLNRTNHLSLPFVIGGVNNSADVSKYLVELYAEPSPARWNAEKNEYETDVYVAMKRPGEVTSSPLPTTLNVTLRGQGDVSAEPRELTFHKSVQFIPSHIRFPRAESEPRVDALPFTEEAPLLLPVRKVSALQVTASPKAILGYGLGTTTVTVTRVDATGNPLEEGPALDLRVASDAARLSAPTIPAGKSAISFKLRSSGSGLDNIKLSTGPVEGVASIQYKPPWVFVAAALIGSLLGASARILRHNIRRSEQLPKFFLEGCVAGLLTTAAVCAGVAFNVFPAAVQETELFAFLVSAAVAMIGVKSVDWMKQLSPKPANLKREESVEKV